MKGVKKMNNMKRVISMLLAVLMVITILPVQEVQAATKSYKVEVAKSRIRLGSTTGLKDGLSFKEKSAVIKTYKEVNTLKYTYKDASKNIKTIEYLSIRDLAKVLEKSKKKFSVSINTKTKKITLATGKTYKSTGKELVIRDEVYDTKTAKKSGYVLYLNGKKQSLTVMEYGGNYYVDTLKFMKLLNICIDDVSSVLKSQDDTFWLVNTSKTYGANTTKVDTTIKNVVDKTGVLFQPFNATELKKEVNTIDEFVNNIAYMYTHNVPTATFEFPTKSVSEVEKMYKKMTSTTGDGYKYLGGYGLGGTSRCPELTETPFSTSTYNLSPSKVNIKGTTCTIKLMVNTNVAKDLNDALIKNKQYYEQAYKIAKLIVEECEITADMSEEEKAYWVVFWFDYYFDDEDYAKEHGLRRIPQGYDEAYYFSSRAWYSLMSGDYVCGGAASMLSLILRYFGINNVYTVMNPKATHAYNGFTTKEGKQYILDLGILQITIPEHSASIKKDSRYFDESRYPYAVSTWEYTDELPDWYKAIYDDGLED